MTLLTPDSCSKKNLRYFVFARFKALETVSIPVRRRHIYQAKTHNKFLAISCIIINYTVSSVHEALSAVEMQQQMLFGYFFNFSLQYIVQLVDTVNSRISYNKVNSANSNSKTEQLCGQNQLYAAGTSTCSSLGPKLVPYCTNNNNKIKTRTKQHSSCPLTGVTQSPSPAACNSSSLEGADMLIFSYSNVNSLNRDTQKSFLK